MVTCFMNTMMVILALGLNMNLMNVRGENVYAQTEMNVCEGDTRGDRKCNHDSTHRVCAKIGLDDTSFFAFTGQTDWCGTIGYYANSPFGNEPRCPPEKPTWCICKWATADWISGETCNDSVEIDCGATDICFGSNGLYFSYTDYNTNLHPARECVKEKCAQQWAECEAANGDGQSVDSDAETDSSQRTSSSSSKASKSSLLVGLACGAVGIVLLAVLVVFAAYHRSRQREADSKKSIARAVKKMVRTPSEASRTNKALGLSQADSLGSHDSDT